MDAALSRLLPVLPVRELCLFPGTSLVLVVDWPAAVAAARLGQRSGGHVLAVAPREAAAGPRDLYDVGTIATVVAMKELSATEHRVELEGQARARLATLIGLDVLVAEAVPLEEEEEGEEWGPAVEALARYLHGHPELRTFLEERRQGADPMSWVNLACQHLPITLSARQKLLEASAAERCRRISRGLDALLRKEQTT